MQNIKVCHSWFGRNTIIDYDCVQPYTFEYSGKLIFYIICAWPNDYDILPTAMIDAKERRTGHRDLIFLNAAH